MASIMLEIKSAILRIVLSPPWTHGWQDCLNGVLITRISLTFSLTLGRAEIMPLGFQPLRLDTLELFPTERSDPYSVFRQLTV